MQPMRLSRRLLRLWRPFMLAFCFSMNALGGCARDVNKGENQEEPFPVQINLMMELGEDPTLSAVENWYYMVFNFGTLNPTEATRPIDQVAGPDRGRNWELYVAFHYEPPNQEQPEQMVAYWDRRERAGVTALPSIEIGEPENGPVDATVGSFNDDEDDAMDLLIAARDGDEIKLSIGETVNIFDDIFYEEVTTVNTGPEPLRIFSFSPSVGGYASNYNSVNTVSKLDLDGDTNQDAVVIFGGGGSGAFLRPLFGVGDGTFNAGTDIPIPGIPVDAIFADFDSADGTPDLAILTVDTPGGAGTVRIYTGQSGGTFATGPTFSVGTDPVQIAAGLIDAGSDLDIAVANAGDDDIDVFLGGDGAAFALDTTLTSPGELQGVTVNTFIGTGGDVAFSFDEANTGNVGVFLREADTTFAETPITRDLERPAGLLVSFDAGNDQRVDVLSLEAVSGNARGNMVIARGERVTPEGSTTPEFAWAETPIIYSTGALPARIVPVDFEAKFDADLPSDYVGDNNVDLLIPSSGTGENGSNVAVYIGLGRYEFADVNIYWTDGYDSPPQNLTLAPWYLSHRMAGKRIELEIDATQFLSLADIPPEELLRGGGTAASRNYFVVDMMTTDQEIDFQYDPEKNPDIGIVSEHFSLPVAVPMTIGHLDNNATNDRVSFQAGPAERNIVDWQVEAN